MASLFASTICHIWQFSKFDPQPSTTRQVTINDTAGDHQSLSLGLRRNQLGSGLDLGVALGLGLGLGLGIYNDSLYRN